MNVDDKTKLTTKAERLPTLEMAHRLNLSFPAFRQMCREHEALAALAQRGRDDKDMWPVGEVQKVVATLSTLARKDHEIRAQDEE